ncbi:MAG TPA: TPM domain-containing protein [Methylomirabilota bacterium]
MLAVALTVPAAPTARVNDYGGLLSAADRDRLESLLTEREQATGTQVVVAIFPSLEGESLEDFSIRLAEKWRIGRKGLDTGVILLVFVKEHKVRLEVGYGLEGVIPDAAAGDIIRNVIAPRFREGQYAAGLQAAIEAVYARVGSGPGAPPAARRDGGQRGVSPLVFFGVLAIIAFVLYREMASGRRFTRGQGYTAGRRGWAGPVIVPPIWWGGSRGGGGGWGGFGGGGFGGGGGFSGGGGSFGGGGASGDW